VFHTRSSIIFLDSAVTAIRSASRRDRGGSTGTLQLRQLAFSGYGLVFFVCAFDAVFELAKLLDHFVGAAGNIATDRSKVDNLTDVEFVRGRQPRFGRQARSSWRDSATRRVAPPDLSLR
jgi:hypothetical protein